MAINHIIFGNQTLIDLRSDTVTADKLAQGYTAHAADGSVITGTSTADANTSDATATATSILENRTAYVKGVKVVGTMTNNGVVSGIIDTVSGEYTVPNGYHTGGGTVSIDATEQAKIIADNIKSGVTILGVTGTYTGSGGTDDATAVAADVLSGKTAYVASGKVTGNMADNGAVTGVINTVSGGYTVPAGYHDGTGTVSIDAVEQAKIIAANIKTGVTILGITGTFGFFTVVSPIATDFAEGYVGGAGGWTYQAGSNNRADVYQVTAGHTYFCRLGDTVGERWRGCFTSANPVTATGDLSGSCVVFQNENNVPKRACFAYKPRVNGYITIVKTRSGVNNIPTYMYDITGFDLLLGGE